MTSALGSNLSELDRLLLELNAVQQSSPSFPTTEEAAPPLPSCSITHYENGGSPDIMVSPPSQEKPKRNGTRVDETRPTVESLLDELEGSVPSPSPPACHSDLDAPPQQQARMSASCATRELDELMASLSDFKPSSLGSLLDPAGASSSSPHPQVSSSVTPVASPFLSLSHMSTCASPLFSLPAGLELHIDEDGGDRGMSMPHSNRLPPHSPISSLSAASDLDLDSVIDVSATMLSSQTKSLLVLSQSASSNSNLIGNSPSPSNTTTTPSLTSVNTVLDHKSSKCPSPSLERASPSDTIGKFSCAPEIMSKGSASFPELDLNLSTPPPSINFTPYLSVPKTPSPLPVAVSISPPFTHASSKTSSPSLVSPLTVPSPPAFTSPSRQPLELASTAVQQPPMVEPSLDEALDKLLAMSFAQNPSTTHVEEAQLKMDAQCLGTGMREVLEELILPMDRNSVQPDTFTSATNTITDDSVDGGTDGNGDLDWADEELSVSLHDGLDGTMTPYTERPYTDGSMTPLTEASWMDESMTPSTCPGTPDVALDLPMLQTPSIDRVSASGHIKSVIRRTKETPNVHPMYRDGHLRRKMGPVIVNKNSSQDRLIEELQGKLGIGRSERRRKQSDDWMTEGVIVTSKPQRFRPDGADSEVDKIIIPPESPVPVRKVPPPLSPPAPRRPPTVEETKRPLPVQYPLPIPPPPPPPPSPPPQPPHIHEPVPTPFRQILKAAHPPPPPIQEPPAPKPEPPPPVLKTPTHPPPVEPVTPVAPKVLVSVGCQTEYDPIFPPMQA
ncbi:fibrous sheath CABYR-binding protein-like isoform X4 [Xiphias gladius]|uniref:fibrous sheath CABYR-binding protein-like isoform X4 n=1 Tax=Xiphias gladius TaxID=8245 RepID=UPI001A9822F3|nr:fibrous sheath CABYR-binding protein-like isoform X4 [Xiphias gladius]